jgi:hypothetical protein
MWMVDTELHTNLAYCCILKEFGCHDANLLKRIPGFEILPSKEDELVRSFPCRLAGWMPLSTAKV